MKSAHAKTIVHLLILSACLATLPGCSSLSGLFDPVAELTSPVEVSLAQIACPPQDTATRLEATRTVQRPKHWGQPGPDGKPQGATGKEMMSLIDQHEIGQARKNGTLSRVIAEHDACRGETKPSS